MKRTKKITTAAFLAGATTLAVTLPLLSKTEVLDLNKNSVYLSELYGDFLETAQEIEEDFTA